MLAALLLAALDQQQTADDAEWGRFLARLASAGAAGLPLLVAHLAAYSLSRFVALVAWLAGFVLYPLTVETLAGEASVLATRHWLIAAGFSILALLSGVALKGSIVSALRRLPITLDGAVIALITSWTLAATSLFASTPDAVNNQPLRIWLDAARIARHPLEFASYLLQFAVVGSMLFSFYWICRYVLIRRVLRKAGWISFALASLTFWIVFPPLACSLVLLLPINPPDWSLLPSENHNPFDPLNYGFASILWAAITPIVLASERLLAERSDAMGRHEQVRAELHILQQQINPHFLFNSLNTLYALCLQDRAASADAVVKLADLLRYAVYEGQKDWTGLDEEIAYIRDYIDLQMLRFGQRCRISCTWPDNAARYTIPPLLLIMLVENAFKHGVEPSDETSEVLIDLSITKGRMQFTCVNSPVPKQPRAAASGLGLGILRRRLELLFDDRFTLTSIHDGAAWRAELGLGLELQSR